MKSFIVFICLLFSGSLHAQDTGKSFAEERKIIAKGICEYEEKNCLAKASRYINACKKIGDQYFKNNDFSRALEYYQLVSSINLDGHGVIEMGMLKGSTLEKYKTVIRSIGDMYLSGAVPPNEKGDAMLYYNIRPSPFSEKERENFSIKIFGEIFYCRKVDSLSNDSIAAFMLNPFFYTHKVKPSEIIEEAKKADLKISQDTTLQANVLFYPVRTNEYEMATIHRFYDLLMEKVNTTNAQRWQLDEFGSRLVEYKKGLCYLLTITTSKK